MNVKSKRVLVTGACGFIGRNLVLKLKSLGFSVTGIVRNPCDIGIEILKADISNEESLRAIKEELNLFDYIFHLSAYISDEFNDSLSLDVNLNGTANLCKFINKNAKFIFASTVEVYGIPEKLPICEGDKKKPVTEYGKSKLLAEGYIIKNLEDFAIARLTSVYGPGEKQRNFLSKFIKASSENSEIVVYNNGIQKRDYLYTDDCSNALILLALKGQGIYNVASGEIFTVNDAALHLKKISNGSFEIKKEFSGKGYDLYMDVTKLKRLGFSPKFNLEKGARATFYWYKKRLSIYFDLDGTLLDVRERYYQIYSELLTKAFYSKEKYWDLKRKKVNEADIVKKQRLSDEDSSKYLQKRLEAIESRDFLKYDKLKPGVLDMLKELSRENDLFIITVRKNRDNLIWQLESLGILGFFKEVLSGNAEAKSGLIKDICPFPVFIGDTEEDMKMAQEFNAIKIAVCDGIREKKILDRFRPDYAASSISDVKNIINKLKNGAFSV